MGNILTIKEICAGLKVTRRTVLSWIKMGELKAFKLGSGRRLWRVKERDLQRFINQSGGKP